MLLANAVGTRLTVQTGATVDLRFREYGPLDCPVGPLALATVAVATELSSPAANSALTVKIFFIMVLRLDV